MAKKRCNALQENLQAGLYHKSYQKKKAYLQIFFGSFLIEGANKEI